MLYRPLPESSHAPEPEKKPLVVVLPGFSAHYRNIRTLTHELAQYGDVEGKVWNSIISQDRPEPNRFRIIAEHIGSALKDKRKVVLVGWSLGAAEVIQSLLTLRWRDKQFPELDLSQLEIVLVSPAGVFEGVAGAAKFLREDVPRLFASMDKDSPYQTLDSLIGFPPAGVDETILGEALRKAYPDLSQLTNIEPESVTRVAQETGRSYYHHLSPEDKETIQNIDAHLATLLQTLPEEPEQYNALRALLKKRGDILHSYQQKLYGGEYFSEPEPEAEPFHYGLFAVSLLGFLPSFGRLVFGKYPEILKTLKERGAKIRILVPEFDVFVTMEQVKAIFPDQEVTVIERSTHTAVFPPQPVTALAEAMRNLKPQKPN